MAELTPQDPIRRRELPTEGPQAPPPLQDRALAAWLSRLAQTFTAHAREIRKKLDDALYGKVNWVGEFSLTNDGITTTLTVQDDRVTSDCEISLMPLSQNAAAMIPQMWIGLADLTPAIRTTALVGQFTVNYPATLDADLDFRYSIKG